ncbi:MAG: DUF5919 domain-containing protein [Nocardioidaceae bacterium]
MAESVQVDPKTVERWIISGRLPHRRHRWAAAKLLGSDEAYLWPETLNDPSTQAASEAEVVTVYPRRCDVPDQLWNVLIDSVEHHLDILCYSGTFLIDNHPGLAQTMIRKAENGARVRLLFGDPDSPAVAARGEEEGTGPAMAARVTMSLQALSQSTEHPDIDMRTHSTTLYNSIYRFDEDMLVNAHTYGAYAPQSPVLHLRQVPGGRMYGHYLDSFDRIHAEARQYPLAEQ